jgi:predicted dehydrogenase
VKVLVVGCGHMGAAHARAYHGLEGFEVAGLVARRPGARERLARELGGCAVFGDFKEAIEVTRPEAVCVATYPDSHAELCIAAFRAGAHVFVEKPLAEDLPQAESIVAAALESRRTLVVGYILRHHPAWARFVELAGTLGRPLVIRVSLNQQSFGDHWATQQQILQSVSPLVDCGVHYVDAMCQMTRSRPVQVQAIGTGFASGLPTGRYNYGQLQVRFADDSVGWFECGWGPMMSHEAHFVRDVVGPRGSVTMMERPTPDGSRRTTAFLIHHAELRANGEFTTPDETVTLPDEPSLVDLCRREQEFFHRAIEERLDLSAHHEDALYSLQVVLEADRSIREHRAIDL